MTNKRVLITGGAGLIGSHIADLLVAGAAARDRRARQLRARPAREPGRGHAPRGRVTIVEGDIRDRALLAEAMHGHRRRVPPGGDPHHPVRRGAAAGARGAGRRHLQRARGGGAGRRVERWSPPRRPRSTAWPRVPDHRERTTRTTTARSTARPRRSTRACCAASTRCTGCNYVALRYFNVYGPRMDIYGAYTEVLIRWMERIAAGQPPLIFGDGTQTMDFVHVARHRARQHAGGASRRSPTRSSTSPAARETSLNELADALLQRHGLATRRRSTAPSARSTRCRAGWPTRSKAQRDARLRGAGLARGRAARAGRVVAATSVPRRARLTHEPAARRRFRSPSRCSASARSRPCAASILSGWVTQGPEVAAFEREFAAFVGAPHACAVSNCTTALHLALLAVGVGPGDEVITVSHSFIATANAIRYCGADAGVRRHRAGHLQHRPGAGRAGDHPRTKAILCVHQMGMPCDLAAHRRRSPGATACR